MNEIINEIFAMGARIRDAGLTPEWLIFIGVLFVITFVLSVRELSQWYLGVYRLRQELSEIRHTLTLIQTQLAAKAPGASPISNSDDSSEVRELEFIEKPRAAKKLTFARQPKPSQNFPLK